LEGVKGVVNPIADAFELDPLLADAGKLPVATNSGGSIALADTRALDETDGNLIAEASAGVPPSEWISSGVTDRLQSVSAHPESRRATVNTQGSSRAFLRFRVSIP